MYVICNLIVYDIIYYNNIIIPTDFFESYE